MASSRRHQSWAHKTHRKFSRWVVYQYRAWRRPIVTIEDVRLRVGHHMSPRIERAVSAGRYERDELWLIGRVLSDADVVLEVGAGLGVVSTYCAQRLGSSRVFAYEANPDLERWIRETYALNQVHPSLEMCAVGAASGTTTLYCEKHLSSSSVVRRSVGARAVEVPCKSLSEIAEQVRPTLLIVDAEGAEGDLFDQAQIPTVTGIVLELHERIIGGTNASRVRSLLATAGFTEVQGLSAQEHLVLRR